MKRNNRKIKRKVIPIDAATTKVDIEISKVRNHK